MTIHKTVVTFDRQHKTIMVAQDGKTTKRYEAVITSLADESDMISKVLKASGISFSKFVYEDTINTIVTFQYM